MIRPLTLAAGLLAAFSLTLAIHLHDNLATAQNAGASPDWKSVLPDADLVKLVDETAKSLKEATISASSFNMKSKSAEGEAFALVILAEAGKHSSNEEFARKCAALQEAALKLADAAKKKKLDEAKKQVAVIAGFKNMKPETQATNTSLNLKESVPIEKLMSQVNELDKKMNGPRASYKRLNAAQWKTKGKTDEVAMNSHKMAAFTMAIEAHVPEKDEDKKPRKLWLEATQEVRAATLEMAAAAKAKKQNDFKTALNNMNSACTKCHDVFRETE